jgi:hypothetical protein
LALLHDPEFKALLDRQWAISDYCHKGAAAPAPANNGGGRPQSAAPQGATDAPAWAPPKPFDDFVYKTGVSKKNGKVWHAWMPPQQGDLREAKFFYPN